MKWPFVLIFLARISGLLSVVFNVMAEQVMTISKVESAAVFNVRLLSEQDLARDQRHDWRLLSKSLLSGVLGYQFGDG